MHLWDQERIASALGLTRSSLPSHLKKRYQRAGNPLLLNRNGTGSDRLSSRGGILNQPNETTSHNRWPLRRPMLTFKLLDMIVPCSLLVCPMPHTHFRSAPFPSAPCSLLHAHFWSAPYLSDPCPSAPCSSAHFQSAPCLSAHFRFTQDDCPNMAMSTFGCDDVTAGFEGSDKSTKLRTWFMIYWFLLDLLILPLICWFLSDLLIFLIVFFSNRPYLNFQYELWM